MAVLEPSGAPRNVTLEVGGASIIAVRWVSPPDLELNGQITGYKIRYKQKDRFVMAHIDYIF